MLDDKKLIDLVKQNPVLYNPFHMNYMDVGMKLAIWAEIGAQLNTDGERCKTRWNNIRDNFNKYLKKSRKQNVKPYRFAWKMEFLKQYLNERGEGKRSSNVTVSENTITEYLESKPEPQTEGSEEEADHEENRSIIATPCCEVFTSVPQPQPQTQPQPRNFRKRKLLRETPSSVLMKYLLQKKSTQVAANQEQQPTVDLKHPVDAFLFSLAPSLKSLPEHLLTLAKSEIFACVQKYEMKRHRSEGHDMNNVYTDEAQEEEEEKISQWPSIHIIGGKRTSISGCPSQDPCLGSVTQTARSSMPTTIVPSHKKQKLTEQISGKNESLKSAYQLFSSFGIEPEETKDEYHHIAKLWTCKLKSLAPMQKRLAERAVNEILFEADLGTLHRNSVQINHIPDPTSTAHHSSNFSDIGSNSVTGSEPPAAEPATFLTSSSTRANETVLFP